MHLNKKFANVSVSGVLQMYLHCHSERNLKLALHRGINLRFEN